jgi:hypothetical protein
MSTERAASALNDESSVTVEVRVVVHVDPTDDALVACRSESHPARFIHDVVRDEIESNLASVSYVRRVTTTCPNQPRRQP